MLTLILLVVLGGGGGLLAVWLLDGDSLAPLVKRFGLRSLRGDRGQDTTADEPLGEDDDAPTTVPPASAPVPEPEPEPVFAVAGPAPVEVRAEPLRPVAGPPRGPRRSKVPAAFTAIEGSHRDVARVPLWRKVTSLVLIVVVLLGAGIALAALAAAALAVAAGLLDGAIG